MNTCIHCSRDIVSTSQGWADMAATGDDVLWRYVCADNDSFDAPHETVNP